MRTYWALFQSELRQHLQYRVAAVAGALTNIAFGFFRIFLLTAFYGATHASQPMALQEVYTYIWFGQVLFGMLPITGLVGGDSEEIRTGAVAYRLVRPISLYSYFYARVLGQKTTALLTRSMIQVLLLALVLPPLGLGRWGMQAPVWRLVPLLAVSLLMALLLSAATQTLLYMSSFWTISTRGSATLTYAVISLFSGLLVPLAFFPPGFGRLAAILPFRGVYDTPARLYTGTIGGLEAALALTHQAAWIAALVALGALLARRGAARLEVAGG